MTPRQEEAITRLKRLLQPHDTIFYVTRSVSRMGIKTSEFYIFRDSERNPVAIRITRDICDAIHCKWKDGPDGGLVSNCFGNDVVSRLSEELFQGQYNLLKWVQL